MFISSKYFEKLAEDGSLIPTIPGPVKNLLGFLADPLERRMKWKAGKQAIHLIAKLPGDDTFVGGGNIFYTPHVQVTKMRVPKGDSGRKKKEAIIKIALMNLKPKRIPDTVKKNITRNMTQTYETSPALAEALEKSQNPVPALKKISKNPEPVYAGGNTAGDIRNVIKSQEKPYRKQLKERADKHSVDMRKAY